MVLRSYPVHPGHHRDIQPAIIAYLAMKSIEHCENGDDALLREEVIVIPSPEFENLPEFVPRISQFPQAVLRDRSCYTALWCNTLFSSLASPLQCIGSILVHKTDRNYITFF